MKESTFNDSSVGTVGSRVVAYSRQYKRTNERKGTSYSTKGEAEGNVNQKVLSFLFLCKHVTPKRPNGKTVITQSRFRALGPQQV